MRYTFLHIADLHYRADWHEETELVCNRFLEDITAQIQNYENVYLVFSGDLVLKGEDDNQYDAFVYKFSNALDNIGLTRERRICVPGNHDVSRSALKPFLLMQDGALSVIKDEKVFNDTLPQLSKTFFAENFKNYISCETKFAHYTCCKAGLGGAGWELGKGIGIYCLNTALCSFGGLEDSAGKTISDKERLHIDTRSLHKWLAEDMSTTRILVMHHPLEWLTDWAKSELENTIADKFHLVLAGHKHHGLATFTTRGFGGSVLCAAPQLFSKKSDLLGYAFISVEVGSGDIDVVYRQWTPKHKFVAGTSLADNDLGKIIFSARESRDVPIEIIRHVTSPETTLAILQAEFDEAITCYSSKQQIWVDRDLANTPETATDNGDALITSPVDLAKKLRSCIIRAPMQFGLTCVGRFIALEHHRNNSGVAVVMVDTTAIPAHKQGVMKHIEARCKEIRIDRKELAGIILDNWHNDKSARRVLQEIKAEFTSIPTIILHSLDDCTEIGNVIENDELIMFETYYLWSLSRAKIRELVVAYIKDLSSLDDDLVTKKLTEDIDALNIHRTPLNCLMILKLLEQAFDDSPVNRTEMIGRVLYLLFYQFDKIPRYATRPDLKDCEYALGYVCEWLIRSSKSSFTKNEFFGKVSEYCTAQILDLDCEVLFSFLVTENIFIRKGLLFEFRFSYWLHFFAAHRMHHNALFAKFILDDGRYTAFPEIIEFYTGIDRRRTDAVIHLTNDLKRMNSEFLERTGIPDDFNPYQNALWTPNEKSISEMQRQVADCVAESALPAKVKDRIADMMYDRSKPYNQELANFINESSLRQMVQAMKGAARALRNSDHVSPEAKTKLLEEVLLCWIRVCQVVALLSPHIAIQGRAAFEGMGFYLGKTFEVIETAEERWKLLMNVIVDNIVVLFQEDIYSKKMGALFSSYVHAHSGSLGELLILLVMARQRPPGWEKEIEKFIVRSNKNSFYLNRIYFTLLNEFKTSFSTERTRQQLRRLAGMSVAKHDTGAKHPNIKLVEKAAKIIDKVK
jgi:hypothetical protein